MPYSRFASSTITALLLSICLMIGLVGCGGNSSGTADTLEGWSVVLITMDTTRRDRIGCYGHDSARTPNLDALAESGVRFDRAITVCPVTLPSHASMLTGTYPSYHGARGNGLYTLPSDQTTLTETLRDAGYQTAAVIASAVLEKKYGLGQGFDTYDDDQGAAPTQFHYPERKAPEITASALRIARGFDRSRPYFLWAHYFDPHGQYRPPAEFAANHADTESGRYDGEIELMDDAIGKLLAGLRGAGLMKRTLVIAVADHGEGFPGPHAERTHGMLLYGDTIDVPFIIAARGGLAGKRVSDVPTGVADIAPTVVDLLELEHDEDFQGRSLAPLLRGEVETMADVPLYAETLAPFDHYGWSPLYQLREGDWMLIWGPQSELYDLAGDPRQLDDVAADHPDRVAALQESLRRLQGAAHPSAAQQNPDLDAVTRKRLEELGYAEVKGGGTLPAIDDRSGLGNPPDLIHLQEPIEEARRLDNSGREGDALRLLREQVISVDPGNLEAWNLISKFALETGNLDAAEQALGKLVEARPTLNSYRGRLADVQAKQADALAKAGRASQAETKIRQAIATYEKSMTGPQPLFGSFVNLAAIHIRRKNIAEAERLLRRAETIDPQSFEVHLNLATILLATRRKSESLEHLARASRLARTDAHRAAVERLQSRAGN